MLAAEWELVFAARLEELAERGFPLTKKAINIISFCRMQKSRFLFAQLDLAANGGGHSGGDIQGCP